MNPNTRRFVSCLSLVAAVLLILGWSRLQIASSAAFISFLSCALFASICKVRIPGIEGTFSLNFLLLTGAAPAVSLAELHWAAIGCGLLQSYWRTLRRPLPIQVLFNVSNLIVSLSFTKMTVQSIAVPRDWHFVAVAAGAVVFYFVNTGLAAAVMALAQNQSFRAAWDQWSLYALPYYVLGSAMASSWTLLRESAQLPGVLVQLVSIYVLFRCFRAGTPAQPAACSQTT